VSAPKSPASPKATGAKGGRIEDGNMLLRIRAWGRPTVAGRRRAVKF
jgi:hypothetical protein